MPCVDIGRIHTEAPDGLIGDAERLRQVLINLVDNGLKFTEQGTLDVYIDGADEFDAYRRLIKGGGGALTREKIIAGASRKFICIVDESKKVGVLGKFPVPIEVIPMARSYIARQLVVMGGQPELREGFITDNGNLILDVHNMDLVDPVATEKKINNLPGVVTCGLFAIRSADIILMATASGVQEIPGIGNQVI